MIIGEACSAGTAPSCRTAASRPTPGPGTATLPGTPGKSSANYREERSARFLLAAARPVTEFRQISAAGVVGTPRPGDICRNSTGDIGIIRPPGRTDGGCSLTNRHYAVLLGELRNSRPGAGPAATAAGREMPPDPIRPDLARRQHICAAVNPEISCGLTAGQGRYALPLISIDHL